MNEDGTSDIETSPGLSTLCVHAGDEGDPVGALHTPLYNHSTFGFPDTESVLDVVEGRSDGNLYTRYGLNPTIRAVEEKLASLEGGEGAYVFSSGMAAESATFLGHAGAGDHLVCIGDVYGGTHQLLTENLPGLGIETTFLLADEVDRLPEALEDRTRIVFFETPTNPSLDVFDISRIADEAHAVGALCVVDNTFATPVNQQPLSHGADLVVHSATKYMGGHSDLTGGVVIGAMEHLEPLAVWRKNLGQIMAPEVAFLLARSLRSLVVRVNAQTRTAERVASFLADHPKVARVNHPSLLEGTAAETVNGQMTGYGGMVSFVHRDGGRAASEVVDRLRIFSIAPSLGGVESLVTQPVTTTHHGMTPEDRARRGIVDGMVRLSCGLEDASDLLSDLENALD